MRQRLLSAFLAGSVLFVVSATVLAAEDDVASYAKYFPEVAKVDEAPVLEVACRKPKKYQPDDPTEGYRGSYLPKINGSAVVGLTINADGKLKRHKIHESTTPRLYKHIRRCLRQAKFSPAMSGGEAISVENFPAKIVFKDEEIPVMTLGYPEPVSAEEE